MEKFSVYMKLFLFFFDFVFMAESDFSGFREDVISTIIDMCLFASITHKASTGINVDLSVVKDDKFVRFDVIDSSNKLIVVTFLVTKNRIVIVSKIEFIDGYPVAHFFRDRIEDAIDDVKVENESRYVVKLSF